MHCYTISDCLLTTNENFYTINILFRFIQKNKYKVALDIDNKILEIYQEKCKSNNLLAEWYHLFSLDSANFEKISVETKDIIDLNELFLRVCSSTINQSKLISYSNQRWSPYQIKDNVIIYRGKEIYLIDKDRAIQELNQTETNNYFTQVFAVNSIVAASNSNIENVQNEVVYERKNNWIYSCKRWFKYFWIK